MPFSKMPQSVKSGVGKSKKKRKTWMSVYEKAKASHGGNKETAAKIAYGAIKNEHCGCDDEMTLEEMYSNEEEE